MADQITRTKEINNDGTASVRTTEVADNTDQTIQNDSLASRIVWFIAGLIAVVLAFRFVFILLGANSASGFANFIYTISHPFAAPFFGLFGYTQVYGQSKFEASTLVAILVYLLVAYGLSKLFTIRRPREQQ